MDSQEEPSAKRIKVDDVAWNVIKSDYASEVSKKNYLDEKTADVFFVCGSEAERIPAHKSVLSKSSPVFDAMFYGPNATETDKRFPETSPNVFIDFLQFCYSDDVKLNPDNITKVMGLLHEYQMTECLTRCGECWADHMTVDDVCLAYRWAIHFEMEKLKEHCERKICAHPQLVFKTLGFISCEHIVLDHILQLDTLLCNESFVLESCLNWARYACEINGEDSPDEIKMDNMRKYLKLSLYRIRFSSMTLVQFREIMDSEDELFTDATDYEEIIRLISQSKKLKTGRFNPNPRASNISWKENRVKECSSKSAPNDYSSGSFNVCDVRIVSNRAVLLGEIICFPICSNTNTQTFTLKIQQRTFNAKEVHNQQEESRPHSEICFNFANNPVVMWPNVPYDISLQCNRSCSYTFAHIYDEEIELDADTIITVKSLSLNYYSIVKKFKFNLL